MPNGRCACPLRILEFLLQGQQIAGYIDRGRETRPDIWAPGAGGANGATGYLIGEAAGFYLRRSQDRRAVLDTSLSRKPEYLTEEAKTDSRSSTKRKEVMEKDRCSRESSGKGPDACFSIRHRDKKSLTPQSFHYPDPPNTNLVGRERRSCREQA